MGETRGEDHTGYVLAYQDLYPNRTTHVTCSRINCNPSSQYMSPDFVFLPLSYSLTDVEPIDLASSFITACEVLQDLELPGLKFDDAHQFVTEQFIHYYYLLALSFRNSSCHTFPRSSVFYYISSSISSVGSCSNHQTQILSTIITYCI